MEILFDSWTYTKVSQAVSSALKEIEIDLADELLQDVLHSFINYFWDENVDTLQVIWKTLEQVEMYSKLKGSFATGFTLGYLLSPMLTFSHHDNEIFKFLDLS